MKRLINYYCKKRERYLAAHLLDGVSTGIATITAHHEEHVDTPHVDALDNLTKVSAPTAGAKDGASLQLNVLYSVLGENSWLAGGVVEALEAISTCATPSHVNVVVALQRSPQQL